MSLKQFEFRWNLMERSWRRRTRQKVHDDPDNIRASSHFSFCLKTNESSSVFISHQKFQSWRIGLMLWNLKDQLNISQHFNSIITKGFTWFEPVKKPQSTEIFESIHCYFQNMFIGNLMEPDFSTFSSLRWISHNRFQTLWLPILELSFACFNCCYQLKMTLKVWEDNVFNSTCPKWLTAWSGVKGTSKNERVRTCWSSSEIWKVCVEWRGKCLSIPIDSLVSERQSEHRVNSRNAFATK